jgi:hypothetical protein
VAPPAGDGSHSETVPGELWWRRRDDVLWRRTLDSLVLLRPEPDGGDPVVVSGGGPPVWDLLEEPRRLHELVTDLAEEFGADSAVVEADVAALLRDLESRGFVRGDRVTEAPGRP